MERFFGNINTDLEKIDENQEQEQEQNNQEQEENQEKNPTDSGDLNDWNMVDETKRDEKNGSYMDLLSSYSTQNVIVEILNNKLHTMTDKIDLILEKVTSLEAKIDKLEEKQEDLSKTNLDNFKFDDTMVYNNFDIKEIMRKIENNDENIQKTDIKVNESTQLYHNYILNNPITSTNTNTQFSKGLPNIPTIGTLNNKSTFKFPYKTIPE